MSLTLGTHLPHTVSKDDAGKQPSTRLAIIQGQSHRQGESQSLIRSPQWASIGYSRSIADPRTISRVGLSTWLRDRIDIVIFRLTLGFVDIVFWISRLKQRRSSQRILLIPGFIPRHKQGWEDQLQQQFEAMAKEEFGIEIDDEVFLG